MLAKFQQQGAVEGEQQELEPFKRNSMFPEDIQFILSKSGVDL